MTDRFRGRAVRSLARILTGDSSATWQRASRDIRRRLAGLIGKDAGGRPLEGHRHAHFVVWFEDGRPARLLVWRSEPFDEQEREAILRASEQDLSWAAPGQTQDAWRVRLVPLDSAVAPPPGFDREPAEIWESVTPYVPPRHRFRRNGRERESESVEAQINREIMARGLPNEGMIVDTIGDPRWVAVHIPRNKRSKRPFLGDKMGFVLRLIFPEPIPGPLMLGHSATFGMGLFRPADPGRPG